MSRIIVPASYNVEIKLLFDSNTGQSELQVRNISKVNIVNLTMIQLAGLLIEHASNILRKIASGKPIQIEEQKENGNA